MRQVMQYLHGDVSPPELAPTHQSFEALALMQEDGFDPYIMSYPSSTATASIGTVSATMSQGR
nr:unknown [Zea mays]